MMERINGKWVEMPQEKANEIERIHWSILYPEAVNREIRTRYSLSDELAILRQRDEKPEEYAEYFAYCEECKALVRQKQMRE